MKNQKIFMKIFIKNRRKPLCIVEIESEKVFADLMNEFKTSTLVTFGQIAIKSSEFRYATIYYK